MSVIYKFDRDILNGENIHVRKKTRETSYKKHWHNYYEIIFYKNCKGKCILNGYEYGITDSCLFFLTPKDFHEIETDENDSSNSVIISFSEQIVDKHLLAAVTSSAVVLYDPSQYLKLQIEELCAVYDSENSLRARQLYHILNCILVAIIENGGAVNSSPVEMNSVIADSISYILTRPQAEITLNVLASRFNLSPTYFSRLFRENTGISFKKYLTMIRIEYAKRLLEENELSIIDIGYECGFNTPSQFVRAFKAAQNQTPSDYRKCKTKR